MGNNPVELVTHYRETGWWTTKTIAHVSARGLQAAMDAALGAFWGTRP
jgi:hypothetical protein